MSFDLQPHLTGNLVELRPLTSADFDALLAVASDPAIWAQHPAHNRWQRQVFAEVFQGALASGGAFAVLDRRTGAVIGSTRFHGYDAENSRIEIGWTFLARTHWGGQYNREMKSLLLDHAFRFVDTVYFYVGAENIRSQKAMEKIGGIRHAIVDKQVHHQWVPHVEYIIRKPRSERS